MLKEVAARAGQLAGHDINFDSRAYISCTCIDRSLFGLSRLFRSPAPAFSLYGRFNVYRPAGEASNLSRIMKPSWSLNENTKRPS